MKFNFDFIVHTDVLWYEILIVVAGFIIIGIVASVI